MKEYINPDFIHCPTNTKHGRYWKNANIEGCTKCHHEKVRKNEGRCNAQLGHGPGHQSTTLCEEIVPHTIHRCSYGLRHLEAKWIGPENETKYTGYFDEPPTVEEED